jgi:hypothetical protein
VETSFPSKLPEYAQFGKPIVIWGPEYCSAIHWGREGDRALCIISQLLENYGYNISSIVIHNYFFKRKY